MRAKAQSFKLLLNKETAFPERLSKRNSKQFVWRGSYLVSKLNLSVSQRQECSHLVLSVCSQPAAGCLIPNLCMAGFLKTTCCVLVHQNQHSHLSVNACQRRTKANAHKRHTLLFLHFFILFGSGFLWGFPHSPHPEKGHRSRLCHHSTSQTSGFLLSLETSKTAGIQCYRPRELLEYVFTGAALILLGSM